MTQLLLAWREGDEAALARLTPLVHAELQRIARGCMRGQPADHTLQATALVHEAYFRLVNQPERTWQNRTHFICIAAQVMRRMLIDHARARLAMKREGGLQRVPLEEPLLLTEEHSDELLALNEALERLAELDARQSRVVELRFFGGLTVEETAEALGIAPKTVKRDWSIARAWLYRAMKKSCRDDIRAVGKD